MLKTVPGSFLLLSLSHWHMQKVFPHKRQAMQRGKNICAVKKGNCNSKDIRV